MTYNSSHNGNGNSGGSPHLNSSRKKFNGSRSSGSKLILKNIPRIMSNLLCKIRKRNLTLMPSIQYIISIGFGMHSSNGRLLIGRNSGKVTINKSRTSAPIPLNTPSLKKLSTTQAVTSSSKVWGDSDSSSDPSKEGNIQYILIFTFIYIRIP